MPLRALLLDAGNTVVFLDVAAVAEVTAAVGLGIAPSALRAVEGQAKRIYEARLRAGASHEDGWGLYMETLLAAAGGPSDRLEPAVEALRAAHAQLNLWRHLPEDVRPALDRARDAGLRLGVVSNSEGQLDALFAHLGIADCFEVVVDSALEGVRKPDPEIFRRALQRMGLAPEEALYAGDIPAVDVDGARAAGLDAALIDPFDFYPDHPGPRHASVAQLVETLVP